MVRNYVKKKGVEPKYSEEKLQRSLHEIQAKTLTVHKASVIYGIPFTTLYCRVKGTRGAIKKSKGRKTALPENVENDLAMSVKTLARWGFGLSRKEIIELVRQFVKANKIKTPFKEDTPGEDWFLSFKRRHNLSIRKPEALEYARKKAATDPFIIYGYFNLLKKILTELQLENKPEQIWNLDESSLSIDPSKSKVVGERGESSSRVTSTSGRENTTFVLAASASGRRAPPLIIFKGKNIWDQWKAPPDDEYPGTAYAATPNGWMETEIFKNYFEKVLIPALGEERPVLVIYDGHTTHVSLDLVKLAIAKDITILKLPAHTSDLLQPLDVSVFKSFKQKWDQTLVMWQRQHVGQKLPKSLFSKFLGETWVKVSEDVIMSGFRKAGIFPFNSDAIPRSNFSVEALERWERPQLEAEGNREDIVKLADEFEHNKHPERSRSSSPSILNPSASVEATPTTSLSSTVNLPDLQNSIVLTPHPKEKQPPSTESIAPLTMEQIILANIHQKHLPNKQKRRKVASGAEVVTSTEMLELLKKKENTKTDKKTKVTTKPRKTGKGKKKTEDSTDANSENEAKEKPKKRAKKGKGEKKTNDSDSDSMEAGSENESEKIIKKSTKKGNRKKNTEDSDSDSTDPGSETVPYANSDESAWMEEEVEGEIESDKENNINETIEQKNIEINKWVIVKYALKKGLRFYVGLVQKKLGNRWEVKFARRKKSSFAWPLMEDIDVITNDSIVRILPSPEITKRGLINFDFKFQNMIIS